jgi:hypothetical protein
MFIHFTCYYGINSIYFSFDYFQLFQNYKIKREDHQIPSYNLIKKTIIMSSVSNTFAYPVLLYFIYDLFVYFGTTIRFFKFYLIIIEVLYHHFKSTFYKSCFVHFVMIYYSTFFIDFSIITAYTNTFINNIMNTKEVSDSLLNMLIL